MTKATDSAYEIIRNAILDGTFQPGDRLKEEKLVALCGVSRTPIREAIQKLGAENYLVSKPNSGSQVADWSKKEVEDIFLLRAAVEGMASARASENITDQQIAALQEQHDKIESLLNESGPMNIAGFIEANSKFHSIIFEAADSDPLRQAGKRLISPPVVIRTAYNFSKKDITRSNAHHLELIEALSAGDGDWCQAIMHSHLKAALNRYLKSAK